jgi:hypothetical protein
MAGFFSRLFGTSGGSGDAGRDEGVPYKGYVIYPAPQNEGGSWRTSGVIAKQDEDGEREHTFIRADVFASRDEAVACATRKGKQIIDERGDAIFIVHDGPRHG